MLGVVGTALVLLSRLVDARRLRCIVVTGKVKARRLMEEVGISETQLSLFRSGKVKGIRFRTLAKLCVALDCVPGDLLDYDRSIADLQGEDAEAD